MHRLVVCWASLLAATCLSACTTTGEPQVRLRTGPPSLNVADAALAAGSPETALNITRILLAKDPRDVGALVREGEAFAALGRSNEAAESFNKAIVIQPGGSPAHLGLGRQLLMQGDAAKAEAEFSQALVQAPRDVRLLVNLGIARDMQGRHLEAQRNYQQALALSPGLMAARVNLGLSYALAGNAPEASATLRPLAEQPDASPSVRHDFALALAVQGKTQEAERAMGQDLPAAEVKAAVAAYRTLNDQPAPVAPPAAESVPVVVAQPLAASKPAVEVKPLADLKPAADTKLPVDLKASLQPVAAPVATTDLGDKPIIVEKKQ